MIATDREQAVRRAAAAGLFYPADPEELRTAIERLLANSSFKPGVGRIRALIAPHAGYVYSGPVAAEAFAALRAEKHGFTRVVVIGPAHRMPVRGIAVPSVRAFATPLGNVPVDIAAIEEIAVMPFVVMQDEPHADEHALEVELPFLQAVFGSIAIVPLLVGSATPQDVARVLSRLWDDDALVVVSSDLSHYLRYDDARRRDSATAGAIERLDEAAIGFDDACGALPIRGLLIEAKHRGLSIERLDLRNSGDTAGDRNRVVGYGAWVMRSGSFPFAPARA
ncbi:AmmeMemoRadiSam system protein B [Rhodoblastus sp.]|uniref:AmmeMemoRadiSam system protein B n=1 Tax=Rhodoblastus sp. TaxID=1962975 RepID=UPI003F9992B6